MQVTPDASGIARARVASGPDLPPGIYLARIEQLGRSATRRFTIVR